MGQMNGVFHSNFLSGLKALRPQVWLEILFGAWLLLAVLVPEDVYRAFFHALIYPFTVYLLIKTDLSTYAFRDPFIRLFLLFCLYMAVTTWFVGGGENDNDFQATRWGVEAALGMVAFYLWLLCAVSRPRLWGRWFLVLAAIGAGAGLLTFGSDAFLQERISGLGAMGHPIQGASIACVLLAVGLFMTFHRSEEATRADLFLVLASLLVVSVFVVLTQSRGPTIALASYLLIFFILIGAQYGKLGLNWAFTLTIGSLALVLLFFDDLFLLFELMASRGSSHRLDLWSAYLSYPPESILFGNGAGVDFTQTQASQMYLKPIGLDFIGHPHNIWIGAFHETGLIGVAMQAGLVLMAAFAALTSHWKATVKVHLFAVLGLFILLTFSDEFTLLISLHPVWIFGWTPLLFVWVAARKGTVGEEYPDMLQDPGAGGSQ
jgi:O-antigen ligase